MHTCVTRVVTWGWSSGAGLPLPLAGLSGLLHVSFPRGLVGFPHSMAAPAPHVSAPGTKAKSALLLLTASSHTGHLIHILLVTSESHAHQLQREKKLGPVPNRRKVKVILGQVWAKEGRWDGEDEDLLGDHILQLYLLNGWIRWPEGRMSPSSGHDRKCQSGIWISDRRAHPVDPLLLSQGAQRQCQAILSYTT